MSMTFDTGERRRSTDVRPVISELIDEATVLSIAEEAWSALDEVLVPQRAELSGDLISSWVEIVGPWTGSVVVSTARDTAAELARGFMGPFAPDELGDADVADAFGEIANVVAGSVKAALPGPSAISLPEVGEGPAVPNPADQLRIDVLWRGRPLSISVQGALPALSVQ